MILAGSRWRVYIPDSDIITFIFDKEIILSPSGNGDFSYEESCWFRSRYDNETPLKTLKPIWEIIKFIGNEIDSVEIKYCNKSNGFYIIAHPSDGHYGEPFCRMFPF